MSDNQSLWADFGVVEELTEQAAETISGGAESFLLYNGTGIAVDFSVDGTLFRLPAYQGGVLTTPGNGLIAFDADLRPGLQAKSYDLDDGGVYVFGVDLRTTKNLSDYDLVSYIA